MRPQTVATRLEGLELKVESLERLPERMHALELQIQQFREKVRVEFSITRADFRAEFRAEIRAGNEETRTYMRVLHDEVLSRIALLDEHRNGRPRSGQSIHARRRQKKD